MAPAAKEHWQGETKKAVLQVRLKAGSLRGRKERRRGHRRRHLVQLVRRIRKIKKCDHKPLAVGERMTAGERMEAKGMRGKASRLRRQRPRIRRLL
jgi:hypothetical protein